MIALAHQADGSPSLKGRALDIKCPQCGEGIGGLSEATPSEESGLLCPGCSFHLRCLDGIWRALLPSQEAHFAQFMQDYQLIRAAEGRRSASPTYYLNLPFRDLSGRNTGQWAIRARTFRYIERRLLPGMLAPSRRRLRILDLGAGNGWMSYRLAIQGHLPTAVDLQTNADDGLGAAIHYGRNLTTLFPRFQAAMDNLPFEDDQFDLVIFNASFHYSENYERTLGEAVRCICEGGTILIADTPWYSNCQSGVRMIEERRAVFTARYGTASDGIASLEFLTDQRLERMARCFGVKWRVHSPHYGIRWSLRPLVARLRGKREPSKFRIFMAKVKQ